MAIRRTVALSSFSLCLSLASVAGNGTPRELRVGAAEYAFDHAGDMVDLSATAAASGVTIIFDGNVGVWGYQGLPDEKKLAADSRKQISYLKEARRQGIRLALGYVCATSMVHLESFDRNWTAKFRAQFRTPPAQWRQSDKNGQPLPSWYGAPYEPACMNNPDWRTYEKSMVRLQLESGCDGIFFDNPTVHHDGCYCPFCMDKFEVFLESKPGAARPPNHSLAALRQWAVDHPQEFLEFRSTIASDFLADMRASARPVKPNALMTCNNSLNSPDALFSQCHAMAYNINGLSRVEDFVTVEDMASQARELPDGRTIEYAPTYKQLHAIGHGKPIVATTLAEADYHASPHLARLSMAEAAANDASWMLWPDWPENMRATMAASILPEAQFLRRNETILNNTQPRRDVLLFLCYRRWLETDRCAVSALAATLSQSNIQYTVCSEENLPAALTSDPPLSPTLLMESYSVLNDAEKQAIKIFRDHGGRVVVADEQNWMTRLRQALDRPSLILRGPPSIRAVVRDQPRRTIVHLYNLNVRRLSSFTDQVTPARQISLTLRAPFRRVQSIRSLTADTGTTSGPLKFTAHSEGGKTVIETTVPNLELSAILIVEP